MGATNLREIALEADTSLANNVLLQNWEISAIVFAVLFAWLVYRFQEKLQVVATALIGAYGVRVGAQGLAAGSGFQFWELVPLGIQIVSFAVGLYVQLKHTQKKEEVRSER